MALVSTSKNGPGMPHLQILPDHITANRSDSALGGYHSDSYAVRTGRRQRTGSNESSFGTRSALSSPREKSRSSSPDEGYFRAAEIFLGAALEATQGRRFDDVIHNGRAALKLLPENSDALYFIGMGYFLKDECTEAEPYLRRAVAADPGEPRNVSTLVSCLYQQKKWYEAREAVSLFNNCPGMTPERREQLARASQEIGGNARVATRLPNGQTEIKWPDGMRYVGGVGGAAGDVPNGRGTYWIDDWKTYEGPVINGILTGPNGKNFQPGGKIYVGDFVDGAYNGYGRLFDESGRLWYEGEFKDNAPHGMGTRYLSSGQKIVGRFEAGYPEGLCTLYGVENNIEYHGQFVKGKPSQTA